MQRLLPGVVFFLTFAAALAQLDNKAFDQIRPLNVADSNMLFLDLQGMGFFRNNEYFRTTVDGYTLFGYQLNPSLAYRLGRAVQLNAGVYAQKDFGNDRYTRVDPTFSLKISRSNVTLTLGTLDGRLHHGLIEPLYDFEHALNGPLENGFQVQWQKADRFLADAWIDWRNMIYQGDAEQEWLWGGFTFDSQFALSGQVRLHIPLQLTFDHRGGQIDNTTLPTRTLVNLCVGTTIDVQDRFGVKIYGALHHADEAVQSILFNSGTGIYVNPYARIGRHFTVMFTYWRGDEFISMEGGRVYASVNPFYPARIDAIRSLFMVRLLYDLPVAPGVVLTARVEPFYDTYSSSLQYRYGLYFNFNDRIYLLNTRRG